MGKLISREEAWKLLIKYNKDSFHLKHAEIVEGVMRYYAKNFDYADEIDFWGIVGLLHDIDFGQYPEMHCIKAQEILKENDIDDKIIRAIVSHGYELTVDIKPEHFMEKVLYAVDELTGLIGAVAIMRPSKSFMDLELSSVKKKFKNLKFAQNCSRDIIEKGAGMLGWEIDFLIENTILAMRETEENEKSEES